MVRKSKYINLCDASTSSFETAQQTFQISSIAQQNLPQATEALREYALTLSFSSSPYPSAKSSLPCAIAPRKTAKVRCERSAGVADTEAEADTDAEDLSPAPTADWG